MLRGTTERRAPARRQQIVPADLLLFVLTAVATVIQTHQAHSNIYPHKHTHTHTQACVT